MASHIMVIGAGSAGQRHAANLARLGARVDLTGWRSTSLAALAARMAQGCDGVVIATATQIRLPLIELAADAGLPVYVEKPLGFTPAGVDAALQAAKPVAQRSVLGFMMRWHPGFRALARADLSRCFRFDMVIGHDVTKWRQGWQFSQSYAARPEGGGVQLDLCHELDMAACLFPGLQPDAVASVGHSAYPGVDMASRISLHGPGLTGSVAMDYLAPALIRRTQICTPEATHDWDAAAQSLRITDATGTKSPEVRQDRNTMFLEAMRDWLALVEGRQPSDVEHLPRLDRVAESCHLIARAWQMRRFVGLTGKDIP